MDEIPFVLVSIVPCAEYLFYVKSIATFALTFFRYIISVLASVSMVRGAELSSIQIVLDLMNALCK